MINASRGMLLRPNVKEISKDNLDKRNNDKKAPPNFKERWVSESNFIPNVLELMQISSFMSLHMCPELAKCFSDNIPKTGDKMLKRADDYVRSQEAFRKTKLPKGEFKRKKCLTIGSCGMTAHHETCTETTTACRITGPLADTKNIHLMSLQEKIELFYLKSHW
ncbi:hypothetical protein Tco_0373596 [Tanacetum coccineum]